jgi:5-methylthioribose kinase
VHGDLHEANIVVTPTGAKVIDILYTHSLAEVGTARANKRKSSP